MDLFEQFRKDKCCTAHKVTATFHDGPIYGTSYSKNRRSWLSMDFLEVKFTWTPNVMLWEINGKEILQITPSEVNKYPTLPMNLLVGHGLGNWGIEDHKLEPFIVLDLTYQPL
jgi:hypothetical protein